MKRKESLPDHLLPRAASQGHGGSGRNVVGLKFVLRNIICIPSGPYRPSESLKLLIEDDGEGEIKIHLILPIITDIF